MFLYCWGAKIDSNSIIEIRVHSRKFAANFPICAHLRKSAANPRPQPPYTDMADFAPSELTTQRYGPGLRQSSCRRAFHDERGHGMQLLPDVGQSLRRVANCPETERSRGVHLPRFHKWERSASQSQFLACVA